MLIMESSSYQQRRQPPQHPAGLWARLLVLWLCRTVYHCTTTGGFEVKVVLLAAAHALLQCFWV
jgi:hypothetical protein